MKHEWGPSRVGHGEAQCIHCLCTNREAAYVLGDECPRRELTRYTKKEITPFRVIEGGKS